MALVKTISTCDAALVALKGPLTAMEEPLPTVAALRKDLLSLLTLIHSYTTRLWMALGKKPSTPAAAISILESLSQHIQNLSGCAGAFDRNRFGNSLSNEAGFAAQEVLQATQVLLRAYANNHTDSDSAQRTGSVHDACDRHKNISIDNREAVAKIWKNDQEALKDAIKEVEELLSTSDEDALDNGWNELDQELGSPSSELTEAEFGLVKKVTRTSYSCSIGFLTCVQVQTVLELTSAFRKRLHKHYLNPNSQTTLSISELDSLAAISQTTVPLFDDIVGALDSPQDLAVLKTSLESLRKLHLATIETIKITSLTEVLESASLETSKGNSCPPLLLDIGKKLQDAISSLCSEL
jgi:Grap2 and cyclin-D-interacting